MQNLTDIRVLRTRHLKDWYATRAGFEIRNFNNFRLTLRQGKIVGFLTGGIDHYEDINVLYKYNFYILR